MKNRLEWLPISEAPRDAIVWVRTVSGRVGAASWLPRWTELVADDFVGVFGEYCHERDEYYCLEGWYWVEPCGYCHVDYIHIAEEVTDFHPLLVCTTLGGGDA